MKKFFQGVAIAAICGTMFFGADFNEVEAAENFDVDLSATVSADSKFDSKAIHIRFGPPPPPPGRRPPSPPPRRPAPPPPRHRYDPPPRYHQPGPPPPHRPGTPHRPGPPPRR